MNDDDEKGGGEEVRSPLQVVIRVVLALLVIAVLLGLILAMVLRPNELVKPAGEARVHDVLHLVMVAMRTVRSR